jgi:DNA-binding NarL/FixJ family response regulator
MTISVFLVDDHRIFLDTLKVFLELEKDISVVGMAFDGRSAISGILESSPQVVVLDITMPELNGIDAITRILVARPDTRIIMLSGNSDLEYIHRSLQMGALGYLLKDSSGAEMVEAIRAVSAGKRYISSQIPQSVAMGYKKSSDSPIEKLSLREREILQLLLEGNNSAAIAEKLGLSPKTVDTYRSRLMNKLGVNDLPALVRLGIRYGLTPP